MAVGTTHYNGFTEGEAMTRSLAAEGSEIQSNGDQSMGRAGWYRARDVGEAESSIDLSVFTGQGGHRSPRTRRILDGAGWGKGMGSQQ